MMLGIDGDLHVVADNAGATAARCHRTAVGIGQGDLLIGRGKHLLLVGSHAPTAERTMNPARMFLESLDRRPGIREQPGS